MVTRNHKSLLFLFGMLLVALYIYVWQYTKVHTFKNLLSVPFIGDIFKDLDIATNGVYRRCNRPWEPLWVECSFDCTRDDYLLLQNSLKNPLWKFDETNIEKQDWGFVKIPSDGTEIHGMVSEPLSTSDRLVFLMYFSSTNSALRKTCIKVY